MRILGIVLSVLQCQHQNLLYALCPLCLSSHAYLSVRCCEWTMHWWSVDDDRQTSKPKLDSGGQTNGAEKRARVARTAEQTTQRRKYLHSSHVCLAVSEDMEW